RSARLIKQQRLSPRVRFLCNAYEVLRIFQRLDQDGDDLDIGIVDKIVDEILDRGAELVAAGNEIGKAERAARHERAESSGAEPAALRDDGDRAEARRTRRRAAECRKLRFQIDQPEAVRATYRHALGRKRFDASRASLSVTALAEPCCQHDG